MPVFLQIAAGSVLLIVCAMLHIGTAAAVIAYLRRTRPRAIRRRLRQHVVSAASLFFLFLISHTVQIYIWAFSLWLLGALQGYEEPIYFALVTYTTVGYGDLTLASDYRIFGAMASITGILMFGMTTAFLVGYFTRVLRTNA